MRLASTANAAEKRPNMVYSYVRNRKHVVFTAYWKVSSAAISKRQIAAKALPAKTCCRSWNHV